MRGDVAVAPEIATAIESGQVVVVVHGVAYEGAKTEVKSDLDPALPASATDPAICGVLSAAPAGGADTGGGGTAGAAQDTALLALGGVALLAAAGAGTLAARRPGVVLTPPAAPGRRGVLAAAAGAVVLATGGTAAIVAGLSAGPPPLRSASALVAPERQTALPSPTPPATRAGDLGAQPLSRSRPLTLTIASLGLDHSPLVELGKQPDGSLEVPSDPDRAGWFAQGSAPGQFGPAVLAGHVDSQDGPAVFYRLAELRRGAIIDVARADGRVARFAVDKVERYAKDRFPPVAVYGDTTHRAELRLITCGGRLDARTGHYTDNIVAYAHLP